MDFTFGVVTGGDVSWVNRLIDSVEKQNIPEYEIIIVGGTPIDRRNVIYIPFDESIKLKWITKKKNLITENAKYENIVYMHDYICLDDNWYDGYLKFGDDFKVCMNKIINKDGNRFRDWVLWHSDLYKFVNDEVSTNDIREIISKEELILPYDINLTKCQYISGAYWVAKKDVMMEFKFDERRLWGQGEDVEWSMRVKKKYDFSMNKYSIVKFMKQKSPLWYECSDETIEILKKIK